MADTQIQAPPGFDALSKCEQLRYLQGLWDRISDSPGELPAPDSHLDLAEERLRKHRANPARSGNAFEVLDRLAKEPE